LALAISQSRIGEAEAGLLRTHHAFRGEAKHQQEGPNRPHFGLRRSARVEPEASFLGWGCEFGVNVRCGLYGMMSADILKGRSLQVASTHITMKHWMAYSPNDGLVGPSGKRCCWFDEPIEC
jgi:hypothetical protein